MIIITTYWKSKLYLYTLYPGKRIWALTPSITVLLRLLMLNPSTGLGTSNPKPTYKGRDHYYYYGIMDNNINKNHPATDLSFSLSLSLSPLLWDSLNSFS